jgi:hypothetical protein
MVGNINPITMVPITPAPMIISFGNKAETRKQVEMKIINHMVRMADSFDTSDNPFFL